MNDIHPTQHPLDGKLEPETKDCYDDRAPFYSIAISLKRIADALDGSSAEKLRVAEEALKEVSRTALANNRGDFISVIKVTARALNTIRETPQ